MTFELRLRDRYRAGRALVAREADIALLYKPVRLADMQVLATVPQPVHAVMVRGHAPAKTSVLRLSDLVAFPLGMPGKEFGVRYLIDIAMRRSSVKRRVDIEADGFEFLRS